MIDLFVVFGATGDLASRYLIPALSTLYDSGKLPEDFRLLGVARNRMNDAEFRRHVAAKVEALPAETRVSHSFMDRLSYHQADISRQDDLVKVLQRVNHSAVFYLALPPALFKPVVQALGESGISEASAVVIEKPFGEGLGSARALNKLLHDRFPERMVFRIDSFLGEQTVHNLLGLRFGNRIFEPVWNCQHIERIDIIWEETLALERRAVYYDRVGALRDMIQNHLLQLLCIVAMEPPRTLSERDFRDKRLEVLRAVRTMSDDEARTGSLRGRYGKGRIGERPVPAYVDEENIDRGRGTETYAAVRLWVDNWRWAGVPFVLRTGKALAADQMEIAVRFRPVPHHPFAPGALHQNILRLKLNPDHIGLGVNISGPCDACSLDYVELEKKLSEQDLSAYARLLLHVLQGKQVMFVRHDEAEESWRIVEPVLDSWSRGDVPLVEYPAGSAGPDLGRLKVA